MKLSEFHRAVADEFGDGMGRVIVQDAVIAELGDRTAEQALASGVPTRQVWLALGRLRGVPAERGAGAGRPDPRD